MLSTILATTYVTEYEQPDVAGTMFGLFFAIALVIIMIASIWQIFKKAGRPGWSAIVPIYNSLQLVWTAGKPWWWILLLCIPFVNFIVVIVLYYNLAKAFGKGVGYTLLLVLIPIIGFPMLAWGNATYKLAKPKNGM